MTVAFYRCKHLEWQVDDYPRNQREWPGLSVDNPFGAMARSILRPMVMMTVPLPVVLSVDLAVFLAMFFPGLVLIAMPLLLIVPESMAAGTIMMLTVPRLVPVLFPLMSLTQLRSHQSKSKADH